MSDYPSFRLDGRRALVTGAARGLGRAISLALADAGADVALGLRDAADVAERIEAMGRRAHRVQMDLLELGQVRTTNVMVFGQHASLELVSPPPTHPRQCWWTSPGSVRQVAGPTSLAMRPGQG